MGRTPVCDQSSRQSTSVALPERIPGEVNQKEYRELAKFSWSLLNTPETNIFQPKLKGPNVIHKQCKQRLREIEESFSLPSGLSQLIDRIRSLMDKKWKMFVLYTDFDDQEPENMAYWSNIQMRKCNLVEWFTTISGQYHSQIVKAAQQGLELDTKEVDEEFLSLFEVVLALEESNTGVVCMKEWERFGTKATLQVRELSANDLGVDDSDGEDDDDDDSDGDDEWFDTLQMEHDLWLGIRTGQRPRPLVQARSWSTELPVRDGPKPSS